MTDEQFYNQSNTCAFVVTNNNSEDVTISEIGLFYRMGAETRLALLYRETFNPVTLAPNESYSFTVNLGLV